MNLSKRMKQAKVCPYLLRNAVIDRPNQAWSIDNYIHSNEAWISLPDSHYRLVQPLYRWLGC